MRLNEFPKKSRIIKFTVGDCYKINKRKIGARNLKIKVKLKRIVPYTRPRRAVKCLPKK